MVELQTFRQQCGDLEQKVANFMQEKEQFEKEVIKNGYFISHSFIQQRKYSLPGVKSRRVLVVAVRLQNFVHVQNNL